MLALLVSLALAGADAQPKGGSLGRDWTPSTQGVHQGVQAGRLIPLSEAIRAVQARIPGHLLDAGLEGGDNGRQVYRVRWAAADGRRLDVIVDAMSGAILRQEG